MTNVFLIREAVVIYKEIGGWLFLNFQFQIIAESINMNNVLAETFSVVDTNSEVSEVSPNRYGWPQRKNRKNFSLNNARFK